MEYIPKVVDVNVYSITANNWTPILTSANAKAIRGVRIKSRFTEGEAAPVSFQVAFNSAPASGATATGNGFLSFSGSEKIYSIEARSGIWIRTQVNATIEIAILQ